MVSTETNIKVFDTLVRRQKLVYMANHLCDLRNFRKKFQDISFNFPHLKITVKHLPNFGFIGNTLFEFLLNLQGGEKSGLGHLFIVTQ
jgi:hypothetical protein